jgi:hypothetical protein
MALNDFGTDLSHDANGMSLSSLGLGHIGNAHDNIPVRESRVVAPCDMIAVLNASIYAGALGFGWPGIPASWHRGGELAVLCDGHVESSRAERIPQTTVTSGRWSYSVFKPDSIHAKRWNNDNQPHAETWPKN